MSYNRLREADIDMDAAITLVKESVEHLKHIEPKRIDALYKDSVDKAQAYYDDLARAMDNLRQELQRLEIIR